MVVVGGGYIGMEVAAATAGWKLDTTVCVNFIFHGLMINGLGIGVYRSNVCLMEAFCNLCTFEDVSGISISVHVNETCAQMIASTFTYLSNFALIIQFPLAVFLHLIFKGFPHSVSTVKDYYFFFPI